MMLNVSKMFSQTVSIAAPIAYLGMVKLLILLGITGNVAYQYIIACSNNNLASKRKWANKVIQVDFITGFIISISISLKHMEGTATYFKQI